MRKLIVTVHVFGRASSEFQLSLNEAETDANWSRNHDYILSNTWNEPHEMVVGFLLHLNWLRFCCCFIIMLYGAYVPSCCYCCGFALTLAACFIYYYTFGAKLLRAVSSFSSPFFLFWFKFSVEIRRMQSHVLPIKATGRKRLYDLCVKAIPKEKKTWTQFTYSIVGITTFFPFV